MSGALLTRWFASAAGATERGPASATGKCLTNSVDRHPAIGKVLEGSWYEIRAARPVWVKNAKGGNRPSMSAKRPKSDMLNARGDF